MQCILAFELHTFTNLLAICTAIALSKAPVPNEVQPNSTVSCKHRERSKKQIGPGGNDRNGPDHPFVCRSQVVELNSSVFMVR